MLRRQRRDGGGYGDVGAIAFGPASWGWWKVQLAREAASRAERVEADVIVDGDAVELKLRVQLRTARSSEIALSRIGMARDCTLLDVLLTRSAVTLGCCHSECRLTRLAGLTRCSARCSERHLLLCLPSPPETIANHYEHLIAASTTIVHACLCAMQKICLCNI